MNSSLGRTTLKICAALAALFALLVVFCVLPLHPDAQPIRKGFTFSVHAAHYLGLDAQQAFRDSVNDLKPAVVRLPVYWDLVETESEGYDWHLFDEQLEVLNQQGGQAILAIGHKLPRWPECHIPARLAAAPQPEIEQALMSYLEAAADHFKDAPALMAWQVENESLFPFGDCPSWSSDRQRLVGEINLVRSIDPAHPILTTDSGELSLWWRTATLPVDDLGISLYRVVFSGGRIFTWPFNPYFYRLRLALVHPFINNLIVTELQTEPWGKIDVLNLSEAEIEASYPPTALAERFDYAARVGASDVLAWGVEWWYYKLQQGDHRYWDAAIASFLN